MNRRPLACVLVSVAMVYAIWFARDRHFVAALLLCVLPPLLLAVAAWRGWPRAGFFAGVAALLWFSHGVMAAWAEPAARVPALVQVALSLAVVYAASIDGLRARFGRRR